MKLILTIITGITIISIACLIEGFVLVKLWGWHVVPLFGLPIISFWQAVGLLVIANMLTHQYNKANENEALSCIISSLVNPLFLLLIGWIAS